MPNIEKRLRFFSLGESELREIIEPVEKQFSSVSFHYEAKFPEILLTLESKSDNDNTIVKIIKHIQSKVKPGSLYHIGNENLIHVIGKQLQINDYTISTAESCTAGYLANMLGKEPGSSKHFWGSVIAYHNSIKQKVLHIDEHLLQTFGVVSKEVAEQMAQNVQALMNTTFGIGISGVAGPSGGSKEKPVGTVHLAITDGKQILHKQRIFPFERQRFIEYTSWYALFLLKNHFLSYHYALFS